MISEPYPNQSGFSTMNELSGPIIPQLCSTKSTPARAITIPVHTRAPPNIGRKHHVPSQRFTSHPAYASRLNGRPASSEYEAPIPLILPSSNRLNLVQKLRAILENLIPRGQAANLQLSHNKPRGYAMYAPDISSSAEAPSMCGRVQPDREHRYRRRHGSATPKYSVVLHRSATL